MKIIFIRQSKIYRMKKRKEYCCKDRGEDGRGRAFYNSNSIWIRRITNTTIRQKKFPTTLTHLQRTQVFRLIHFHFFYGKKSSSVTYALLWRKVTSYLNIQLFFGIKTYTKCAWNYNFTFVSLNPKKFCFYEF